MIGEIDARVLLEDCIRERVRAIKNRNGDAQIRAEVAIETLRKVLEYDDFTIFCITHNIKVQEDNL